MQGKNIIIITTTLKGLNRENILIAFAPSKFAQNKNHWLIVARW